MRTAVNFMDTFIRWSGCTDPPERIYVTYAELSITVFYFTASAGRLAFTEDDVSMRMLGLLCTLIECIVFLLVWSRYHHRAGFARMYRYSKRYGTPDHYRRVIRTLAAYNAVASNVFVVIPVAYAALSDSVRPGDPFTFPFIDVLPVRNVNLVVYAAKYLAYSVSVYIAFVETCFINTTFIYFVGVLKLNVETIAVTIREAVANHDERKLRAAIANHQDMLKYFKLMKIVFAKPLLLSISFNAIYISLTTLLVIQTLQGIIDHVLLLMCIASGVAAITNVTIYSICGSILSDAHDTILRAFFNYPLLQVSRTFQKNSLIMMARSMVPLEFTVGYIFTANLHLLVKILKMSYSILNVLLASITPQKSV